MKRSDGYRYDPDHPIPVSAMEDKEDQTLPHISTFTRRSSPVVGTEGSQSPIAKRVVLSAKKRPIKIHIGWMHKVGDKYRQVRRKYGGGTRELILENLNIYPTEIVQRAITLFFPNGTSEVTRVEDVESFSLGNFCGEELQRFTDENGSECSLAEHLKSQGTYASRCYIYLLTNKREEEEVSKSGRQITPRKRRCASKCKSVRHEPIEDNGDDPLIYYLENPSIAYGYENSNSSYARGNYYLDASPIKSSSHSYEDNGSAGSKLMPTDQLGFVIEDRSPLDVKYMFDNNSPFSLTVSPDTEFTRSDCLDFSTFCESQIYHIEDYEPTRHGFVIKSIVKSPEVFLTTTVDKTGNKFRFVFPRAEERSGLIEHHPSEIWGYCQDVFLLGVVARCHGMDSSMYTWYRDGSVYSEGTNLCCISIRHPGVYHCRVTFGNCFDVSRPFKIVELSECFYKTPKLEEGVHFPDIATYSCQLPAVVSNSSMLPDIDRETVDVEYANRICLGTYGAVYRGQWLMLDICVEVVDDSDAGSKAELWKDIREVSNRIRHPNILSAIACTVENGHMLVLSDFNEGVDLFSVLFDTKTREHLQLEETQKQNIAVKITSALSYLHGLSPPIMHRAVHTRSVLVLYNGSTAKLSCPDVRRPVVSEPVNARSWAAPECLVSQQDASWSSDVWGMGATLTEMFTEKRLWMDVEGVTSFPVDVITQLMEHGRCPPAPRFLNVHSNILTACLSIDPSLRPSAAQLLSHLKS